MTLFLDVDSLCTTNIIKLFLYAERHIGHKERKKAFFSGLKQNFKNTWKKNHHDEHEESLQGADQSDGGRIETERNVLVDRIPPGKGELLEDVNSVDLTKG